MAPFDSAYVRIREHARRACRTQVPCWLLKFCSSRSFQLDACSLAMKLASSMRGKSAIDEESIRSQEESSQQEPTSSWRSRRYRESGEPIRIATVRSSFTHSHRLGELINNYKSSTHGFTHTPALCRTKDTRTRRFVW